jgi:hypothetical protein
VGVIDLFCRSSGGAELSLLATTGESNRVPRNRLVLAGECNKNLSVLEKQF